MCMFLFFLFFFRGVFLVFCVALVKGFYDFVGDVEFRVAVEHVVDARRFTEDEVEAFLLGVGFHEVLNGVGQSLQFFLIFFLE